MMSGSSFILPDQICQRFTLAEIQLATQNFDEKLVIGHGGFGKVYKCPITIGSAIREVAIKRLDSKSSQGATEFEAEVKVLSKLRHANLVSLIGYCNEGKEMVLAYEFVPNGTIRDHLRKADCALSWLQRLKICIGAARALDYLHTGTATQQGIIHRDVKTSNILLDANFDAKLSDFGLAKIGPINQTRTDVSTGVKGTFGYMDPCYFFSGKLTRKSDVYAFGVVLFEVLSGKQAVDSTLDDDQWSLAAWVQDQIREGKLNKIIDSRLIGQISKKCLKEFAGIAGQCLQTQPKQRPMMAEVVVRLEYILSHERELANSVIYEERFMDKVRSFFTGGKSEVSVQYHTQQYNKENLRIFKYTQLRRATNNFKDKKHSPITHESIYEGWVDEMTYNPTKRGVGLAMYVRKKLIQTSKLDLKTEEFNHPNLVKLLGFCLNEDTLFCVYELLPDASLDTHLFEGQGRTSLSWVARLKIAIGAAKGLSFLHQRNHPAYKQFRTTHILVDTDFNTRLSGFEVENSYDFFSDLNLCRAAASHVAPEVLEYQLDILDGLNVQSLDYGFGMKTEVYYFGVVLLEILTGMKAFDVNRPLERQNLVKWATSLRANETNLVKIMDPLLLHYYCPPKGAVIKLFVLILNCLQQNKEKRPSMEEILQVLYECYQEDDMSI